LGALPRTSDESTDIANSTKNPKNKILAMPDAEPAIPPNPKTAAMSAITKKVTDQFNMCISLLFKFMFQSVCRLHIKTKYRI